MVAIAALGGLVGAFASASPTGWGPSDVVLRAGAVALLSLAASRARRWTWIVCAGIAAVGAPSGLWFAVGAATMVAALIAVVVPRRRVSGAIVGALSGVVLLHLPDRGVTLGAAWLTLAASVPVFVSAYLVSPRRVRRRVHRGLAIAGAVVAAGFLCLLAASLLAYSAAQRGASQARTGLAAVGEGDSETAVDQLGAAAEAFGDASTIFGGWWMAPARAVPVFGQQVHAVRVMADEGRRIAATGARAALSADPQELRYEDGRIDLALVEAATPLLEDTAVVLEQSRAPLAAVDSPWLVGPVASALSEFRAEVDGVAPDARTAADAARVAPELFGGRGTRRYLVLFTTPSETRGLGGFIGSFAVLTAVDGKVELTRSGRPNELNTAPGNCVDRRIDASTPALADYVARYGRFQPECFFQDLSFSPDLPTVAAVAAQLFPQMGGVPVDGVLALDPYALAGLLEFTGPVSVEGVDEPLTADNAADFLVREQYLRFEGAEQQRRDALADASEVVFEELTRGSLPAPRKVADVLAPLVAQGRLGFVAFDPEVGAVLDRVGVSGRFEFPPEADAFQLVTQNGSNNKIDLYLQRRIGYDVRYDPGSGRIEATATITLENTAPAEGLPPAVIGSNDRGLPLGMNRVYVSFYTGLALREARIDDVQTPLEFQRELGKQVYSTYLEIPSGASRTITLELRGSREPGSDYRLVIGRQPVIQPDSVDVELRLDADWQIDQPSLFNPMAEREGATLVLRQTATLEAAASVRRR